MITSIFLESLDDKTDLICRDEQEFRKLDQQQRIAKYSEPFVNFMHKCEGVREVGDQFTNWIASAEHLPEIKRVAQLRERIFDKASNEPTDAKIILDGFVAFYSSPRGNLLKMKDFFDSHALCYGSMALIPGNKTACDYIVKPERVDNVLGGNSWHGQPHLRNDRSRVGLCPSCLESLLKMRIESHHTFLTKIRNSLASNKDSPHAKAATEKEKQLKDELSSLQNDLERVSAAKLALEKVEEEDVLEKPGDKQTSQRGDSDEGDVELMSILHQEPTLDPMGSHEDKQEMNDVPFDQEESSNSEQNQSTESVRLTRAAKKKETTKLNKQVANREDISAKRNSRQEVSRKSSNSQQKNATNIRRTLTSQKLKLNSNTKEPAKPPNTRSSQKNGQNNNLPSIEQAQGQKRKYNGDDQKVNKKRKLQSADDRSVPYNSTTEGKSVLTLHIDDTTCSYPITTSQMFLFNALAVAVSPEFTKNAEMRTMYHDSMSQVDLATLSHLKDMLSLAHTKKCESMGLK